MRILLVYNAPRKRDGGLNRMMHFLHDPLVAAGHRVDHCTAEDLPPGTRGRLGRFIFPLVALHRALAAERRGEPYDVINVHEPNGAPLVALRRRIGSPKIIAMSFGLERGAWQLALEEARLGRLGPTLKSRVLQPAVFLPQAAAALRGADHVFTASSDDTEALSRELGIPRSRVTQIFPGADRAFATASQGRDYRRVERVLFAASWRKNKGIEDLVPAFSRLAERHPALRLVVLGGGVPDEVVLSAFPRPLRGRIELVAAPDAAATAAEFARADLYLLPSLYEGNPLTLVEAMVSGLPIITTATCGMKDTIVDGETGLLIPVRSPAAIESAVERLLESEALRARLGAGARRVALERSLWEHVSVPVRETYQRLLGWSATGNEALATDGAAGP